MKSRNLQGDSNARCTRGRENVGQSNYMPESMCASHEGSPSNGEARAIGTRLEPQVSPSMPVKKKSRILWNEAKEKGLCQLGSQSTSITYARSNNNTPGCVGNLSAKLLADAPR